MKSSQRPGLRRGRRTASPTSADPAAFLRALDEAAAHFRAGRLDAAAQVYRRLEREAPGDVRAAYSLATIDIRQSRLERARRRLEGVVALQPALAAAQHNLGAVCQRLGAWLEAAEAYGRAVDLQPQAAESRAGLAAALAALGRVAEALAQNRELARDPTQRWAALTRIALIDPAAIGDDELAAMQAAAQDESVDGEIRIGLLFALGDVFDRRDRDAEAFAAYAAGNRAKRATLDPEAVSQANAAAARYVREQMTPARIAALAGQGSGSDAPIFIVGLPRSGSTLIEQILASHSQIEGTMELRVLPFLVGRIGAKGTMQYRAGQSHPALATDSQAPYPECLRNLFADDLKVLGEEYLERAHIHRVESKPFFIDKMPDNFAHIGLIHLMLPNAKIIDARRDPMACCFSAFKHYFPLGKDFSYSLSDLGRYYSDYVQLMAHWDRALPGKIHRVHYEHVVEDSEREIRRLFDYLELPFEEQALRFHETERAVRTASADQVRRPIFKEGLDDWRHFEEWLGPLKSALGATLAAYADELKADR